MNPTPEEILEFTSKDYQTKSMTVTCIWPDWLAKKLGRAQFVYDVPPAFQLDLYVHSLHPDCNLQIEATYENIVVQVFKGNKLIETHTGVYWNK